MKLNLFLFKLNLFESKPNLFMTEVPTDVITELSVDPAVVNRNIKKSLIKPNMTLIGSIRSVEDNGYLLDAGIRKLEIFLPFSETPLKGLTF